MLTVTCKDLLVKTSRINCGLPIAGLGRPVRPGQQVLSVTSAARDKPALPEN